MLKTILFDEFLRLWPLGICGESFAIGRGLMIVISTSVAPQLEIVRLEKWSKNKTEKGGKIYSKKYQIRI
jgi:hypothetical protein